MNDLAHRLKTEREAKGWSQPELSDKSRVKQSFIGALEARNQKSSSWLPELAHALGVDAYWLKTGKGDRAGGRHLSEDEKALLDALPLLDADVRESWIELAKKKLGRLEASKQKAA